MRTLCIDIGGTGIKMLELDAAGEALGERHRERTPRPARPEPVLACIGEMLGEHAAFDRVSIGFPGVIVRGVVRTAPNLDTGAWAGFDLEGAVREMAGKPVRALNDADLQGYGVVRGRGVELALTLGTGMGSALFTNGHLVPNLELGHHPFKNGRTYEECVSDAERDRIGKKRWRRRLDAVIAQLAPIFNYDLLHLGGGNAKRLTDLPANVRVFTNVEGMTGGMRLWQDEPPG